MNLTRSKGGKRQKSGGKSSPEERFNRAWRRVQRQQKKNDRFLVEVEQFVAGIEAEIG